MIMGLYIPPQLQNLNMKPQNQITMSPNVLFDIQVEIIKRSPVKSLIRFRSVSKPWKSVIHSSQFITDHSINRTHPHHMLIRSTVASKDKYIRIVDNDSFPLHKCVPTVHPTVKLVTEALMLDCCNGLVCLYGSSRELKKNVLVVWNPSIRKSVGVLLPDGRYSCNVGFGVCPKTGDVKIVKMTRASYFYYQAEVLTLTSRAWRSVPMPYKLTEFRYGQVVVDGVIHWVFLNSQSQRLIISFDLVTEEFGQVNLPDDCLANPKFLSISKVNESLVVVRYLYEDANAPICDVWMMKKNGDLNPLFTKLYTVGIQESDGSVGYQVIGFRKNGEAITEHVYPYDDNCLSSILKVYDPCSKDVYDLGIGRSYVSLFKMTSYSESLLLLNHPDSVFQS